MPAAPDSRCRPGLVLPSLFVAPLLANIRAAQKPAGATSSGWSLGERL